MTCVLSGCPAVARPVKRRLQSMRELSRGLGLAPAGLATAVNVCFTYDYCQKVGVRPEMLRPRRARCVKLWRFSPPFSCLVCFSRHIDLSFLRRSHPRLPLVMNPPKGFTSPCWLARVTCFSDPADKTRRLLDRNRCKTLPTFLGVISLELGHCLWYPDVGHRS